MQLYTTLLHLWFLWFSTPVLYLLRYNVYVWHNLYEITVLNSMKLKYNVEENYDKIFSE